MIYLLSETGGPLVMAVTHRTGQLRHAKTFGVSRPSPGRQHVLARNCRGIGGRKRERSRTSKRRSTASDLIDWSSPLNERTPAQAFGSTGAIQVDERERCQGLFIRS